MFEEWGLSVFLAASDTGQKKVHIRKTNQNNCSVEWHEARKGTLVAHTNDRQYCETFLEKRAVLHVVYTLLFNQNLSLRLLEQNGD